MIREWYREDVDKIIKKLNTSAERGLTSSRVKELRTRYGSNILSTGMKKSFFTIFIDQFKSPLIYVLIIASLIVYFLGDYVDASIIIFIILLNAIIGAVQEGKAQDTVEVLRKMVKGYATVVRNGDTFRISDTDLVPGDIILLKDSNSIPADCRLIETKDLKINESAFTGESEPIVKHAESIGAVNLNTADQKNMVFRGTYVISGLARAVVVSIGHKTVIGHISKKLTSLDIEVPLKKNIKNLSRVLVWVISIFSAIIFLFGVFNGREATEMFLTVVAMAVSAIPESLPVAVTLVLATGVWRMSKQNVLVKKMQAVEALGQARVIALDKTGTITKNQMMVEKIYTDDKVYDVTGNGYEPKGNITENKKKVNFSKNKELDMIAKISAFTAIADVQYSKFDKDWILEFGDPTEASLLVLARKFGYEKNKLESKYTKIDEIPFNMKDKFHAAVNVVDGKNLFSVSGSPEVILKKCRTVFYDGRRKTMTTLELKKIETAIDNFSNEGYRILALAANLDVPKKSEVHKLPELTFVGLVAILDSIRPEVKKSVISAKGAGMQVIMITGDHAKTASAIASKVGIYNPGDLLLTGDEINEMNDVQLAEKLEKVTVFARVTPEDKLRIIQTYKNNGKTIAMTGDGINDALSLVSADLGVAMGKVGTEVAKEAADVVLLDDKFGNIIDAAEEGRNIYMNIRKTILYLLSTNTGEILVIAIAVLASLPLPLIATQIIWLNFITDTFLVAALAMDSKGKGLLNEKFKKPSKYIIDGQMFFRILLVGGLMTAVTLYLFSQYIDTDLTKAWTISLTMLTVFQWYNIFNVKSHKDSVFSKDIFENKYLVTALVVAIGLHLFAIYTPFMQKVLHTTGLTTYEWIVILVIGSSIILFEEIRKFIYRYNKEREKMELTA